MKTRALIAVALVVGLFVPGGVVYASISGTSGQVSQISPPASVTGLTSNTTPFAWDEQQGVTLASAMRTDITTPGSYFIGTSLTPGLTIPAGTVVDSHYFHSRPVSGTKIFDATLTFPSDIVGVDIINGQLNTSDILGAPSTSYAGLTTTHGLELVSTSDEDGITIPDLRTIIIHVRTGAGGDDDVRIITRHNGPP
ncbi:MAG TPA: hypothetical protein VIK61_20390, partial [Acidimicrobiia bacterium]